MSDPVEGRLDDAYGRVVSMEQRALRGEMPSAIELATEMRIIREDMLADRRDVLNKRQGFDARLNALDERKQDKPTEQEKWTKRTFIGSIGSFIVGVALWLVARNNGGGG